VSCDNSNRCDNNRNSCDSSNSCDNVRLLQLDSADPVSPLVFAKADFSVDSSALAFSSADPLEPASGPGSCQLSQLLRVASHTPSASSFSNWCLFRNCRERDNSNSCDHRNSCDNNNSCDNSNSRDNSNSCDNRNAAVVSAGRF
jgi:hypothetical protein